METHFLRTTKTAVVNTFGDPQLRDVVLLIHGYAQRAEVFLDSFQSGLKNHFLVAPEGLSAFYPKGLKGEVGASWMTSHNRENEILDYVTYLNNVAAHYDFMNKNVSVVAFSQGVSTVLRWLKQSTLSFSELFLVAGTIPDEVTFDTISYKNAYYLHGTKDLLIDMSIINSRINEDLVNVISYEGRHEINEELINIIKHKL